MAAERKNVKRFLRVINSKECVHWEQMNLKCVVGGGMIEIKLNTSVIIKCQIYLSICHKISRIVTVILRQSQVFF